jgi:tetratricopeptide (TPR) repeat protein
MRNIFLTTIIAIAFIFPAAAPASAEAGFPLNPGNRWEYQRQDGSVDVLSITGCREYLNIPLCEASFNNRRTFYLLPTTDGLFRINFDPDSPAPGKSRSMNLLIAPEPLEVDLTWSVPWGSRPLVLKVVAIEDTTVPAGYISEVVKIGYRSAVNPIYEGYMWYAPGVGIVAQQEDSYRSELRSFVRSEMLAPEPGRIKGEELALLLGFAVEQSAVPEGHSKAADGYILHGLMVAVLLLGAVLIVIMVRKSGRSMELSGSDEVSDGEIMVARSMVKDGLFGEAIEILERLTKRHPDWPDLAADLGKAYLEKGMIKEASMELKRALTLNSDLYMARVDLVRALLAAGEPAGALTEVEAVLAEHPSFADALCLKGETVLMLGNREAARELFEEALALNPHFARAREALGKITEEG